MKYMEKPSAEKIVEIQPAKKEEETLSSDFREVMIINIYPKLQKKRDNPFLYSIKNKKDNLKDDFSVYI